MNEIKLSKMEIRNFKGIKDFTLVINGQNASIFGENGTGKTTLNDAFLWVPFGKDSANRADFAVKPQDKDGHDVHFLETDVTLHLLINGQPKILRKMLEEVWTKKRGEASKEFTGHQTSYWVDTVPVKKKEYTDQINAIIDENAFKLLANPFYFCTQLSWQDRRKTLMEICGDVSDADVIASDKSLNALTDILSGRSINDQRKIITERIKRLNGDIEAIPIKINELSRTVLGEDINYSAVEAGLKEHNATLKGIEQSMMDASQITSAYRQKQQDAFKLTTAIEDRKKELDAAAGTGSKRLTDEKTQLENEDYRLANKKLSLVDKIESGSSEVTALSRGMANLRDKWSEQNSITFTSPDADNFICPTCKRPLPEQDIEKQTQEMFECFNTTKQATLTKINQDGKALKERKVKLEEDAIKSNDELFQCEARMQEISERLLELESELSKQHRPLGVNYEADAKYSSLQVQLQAIKDELNMPIEDTISELIRRKNEVTEQINTLNKLLNNRDVAIRTKERIDELKDEERTLSSQLSEFEKQRFLIEQFIKAKVNLLEGNINSRFKLVKWKLFDVQINTGIKECCEAMVDGSCFNTNLNHANKVNAGLDIINVLATHYGCTAPIFIDFRESVSRIIETGSQVINLIKSEPDKTLRVEVA